MNCQPDLIANVETDGSNTEVVRHSLVTQKACVSKASSHQGGKAAQADRCLLAELERRRLEPNNGIIVLVLKFPNVNKNT